MYIYIYIHTPTLADISWFPPAIGYKKTARFFSAFDSGNLAGAQFARPRPASEAVSKKAPDRWAPRYLFSSFGYGSSRAQSNQDFGAHRRRRRRYGSSHLVPQLDDWSKRSTKICGSPRSWSSQSAIQKRGEQSARTCGQPMCSGQQKWMATQFPQKRWGEGWIHWKWGVLLKATMEPSKARCERFTLGTPQKLSRNGGLWHPEYPIRSFSFPGGISRCLPRQQSWRQDSVPNAAQLQRSKRTSSKSQASHKEVSWRSLVSWLRVDGKAFPPIWKTP